MGSGHGSIRPDHGATTTGLNHGMAGLSHGTVAGLNCRTMTRLDAGTVAGLSHGTGVNAGTMPWLPAGTMTGLNRVTRSELTPGAMAGLTPGAIMGLDHGAVVAEAVDVLVAAVQHLVEPVALLGAETAVGLHPAHRHPDVVLLRLQAPVFFGSDLPGVQPLLETIHLVLQPLVDLGAGPLSVVPARILTRIGTLTRIRVRPLINYRSRGINILLRRIIRLSLGGVTRP